MHGDRREKRIRELAYAIWEQEGRPEGRAERNWSIAEKTIQAMDPIGDRSSSAIAAAVRRIAMTEEEERDFIEKELGAREALQAVENALVDAGYDRFVMATDRGTWTWEYIERRS